MSADPHDSPAMRVSSVSSVSAVSSVSSFSPDQALARRQRLVQGAGSYIGDILPAGTLHAAFVRSYLPSARIVGIDTTDALAMPGVAAVYTGADLASLVPLRNEAPGLVGSDWHALPSHVARYVGEPLAVVLADDPYLAEDAAEAVIVDLEPLPAVTSVAAALADGAPLVHEAAGTNLWFDNATEVGDPDEAFRTAPIVIERTFQCARQTPLPLEPRGVLASVEASTGQLVMWTSTQIPHIVRSAIATSLGRSEPTVRVITPDVGGGFGLKAQVFSEELALAHLAVETGRPVRWIEDRRENLIASYHAHGQEIRIKLAADRNGMLLAADIDVRSAVGAYSGYPFTAALESGSCSRVVLSSYRLPSLRVKAVGVGTNHCPIGAYRGVGMPGAMFATERILDVLAAELDMDRAELRMKNLLPSSAMPYRSPFGRELDSGDYPAALAKVLERADYPALVEQRRTGVPGVLVGIGICVFNEPSGMGSIDYRRRGHAIPGFDSARVEMSPDGIVTVYVSSADAGQDHIHSYRLVAAERLGVPVSRVRVITGDTATCPPGSGTFGSRSGTAQLSAVFEAATALRQRITDVAALVLGVEPSEVLDAEGGFATRDGSGRVGIDDVAQAAHRRTGAFDPPPGFEPGLEVTRSFDPAATSPYGAHVSVVHVDPRTYAVKLVKHVTIEDCGVIINEAAVHEQVVGGIAMGIGNVLFEEIVYDEAGEIRTSSLLDYLVPLAGDMPQLDLSYIETPSDRTPLGSKGAAEAGTIGAVGAIGAAVADALSQLGAELNEIPASPQRLFDAVQRVGAATRSTPTEREEG